MSTFTKDALIRDDQKPLAFAVYKEAVAMLGNKNFCYFGEDAGIELCKIFRNLWFQRIMAAQGGVVSMELFAEAYRAFNYANMALGTRGRFAALVDSLVSVSDRRERAHLVKMGRQINGIITSPVLRQYRAAV
jgi:hypothetical protein